MNVVSNIEIQLRFLDPEGGKRRRRTTGGPMPSDAADRALHAAQQAAEKAVKDAGFTILGCGYGVSAKEYA